MNKTHKVTVDLDGFRTTETGKPKIWRSDLVHTFCCTFRPSFFIWEKNTKHNDYCGYNGYVDPSVVTVIH